MSEAARLFLSFIKAPTSADMVRAVDAWLRAEGSTVIGNNPWNLHIGPDCPPTAGEGVPGYRPSQRLVAPGGLLGNRYAGPGDRNVAIFDTLAHGCAACATNLISHGSDWAGYDHVLAALRDGNAVGFLNAIAASAWSAGHYGYPAHNRLLDYYAEAGGVIRGGEPMLVRKAEGWTAGPNGAPYFDGVGGKLLGTIPAGVELTSIGETMDGTYRLVAISGTGGAEPRWVWMARNSLVPLIAGGDPAFDAAVQKLLIARAAPVLPPDTTPFDQADVDAAVSEAITEDRAKAHVEVSYD